MTLDTGIYRVWDIFSSRVLGKNFPINYYPCTKKEVKYHMENVLKKIIAIAECVLNAVLAVTLMLSL